MFIQIQKEHWDNIKKSDFKSLFFQSFIKYALSFIVITTIFNFVAIRNTGLNIEIPMYIVSDIVIPVVLAFVLSISNCYFEKKLNFMIFEEKNLNKKKFKLYYTIDCAVWLIVLLNLVTVLEMLNLIYKPIGMLIIEVIATFVAGIVLALIFNLSTLKKLKDRFPHKLK